MKRSVAFVSSYLSSEKPCGNYMLSASICSAFEHLSVPYYIVQNHPIPPSISHSSIEIIKIKLVHFLARLLRLKFSKHCALTLLSIPPEQREMTFHLYDGYDDILNSLLTPRSNNYLIASDLYSRASLNSLRLWPQHPLLMLYRFFYYLRALIIENILYRNRFNKVFFVSSLDTFLYNNWKFGCNSPNGLRIPFSLPSPSDSHFVKRHTCPQSKIIRLLFTGNFDQANHVESLFDSFTYVPLDHANLDITVQSIFLPPEFICRLKSRYPTVHTIGQVPSLDNFYSEYDFIVFTNKQTTGIQTKYLHAFKMGAIVVAPQCTAADFGSDLVHNKNILLYNSFNQIFPLVLKSYYDPDIFNYLKSESFRFFMNNYSPKNTLMFVDKLFL